MGKTIHTFGVKQFIEATRKWKLLSYVPGDQARQSTETVIAPKTARVTGAFTKGDFTNALMKGSRPKSDKGKTRT